MQNVKFGARSHSHCCRKRAVSIEYYGCVSVALLIQYAKRMRRIMLSCGLSGPTIFFHITSQMARFSDKSYLTQNVCFDFPYNICLKHFSF
jgi:hypothetical protein